MAERHELEGLFLGNLAAIERIVGSLCRRYHLRTEDAEDFASVAKLKLVENSYEVFRKFRGESSISTYLTVVIAMLFRDYRVHRWGRWRPSAVARRRGETAVRLESLVYRDGLRLEQAVQAVSTSGNGALSKRELTALFAELPARAPVRPVDAGSGPLAHVLSPARTDDLALVAELDGQRRTADEAITRALERLPVEDRLIVRMRFWDGLSVADIARAIGLEQKPLYRRIDRSLAELRGELEAAGVSRDRVKELVEE